uniref:Uncharacterized protein n=1 Tax=Tanacetum cinerariifolium TaxID=118510 RepID=A0A6L2NJG3_TANCI|nr:hypothetical protein [Tanacetum cinerariifolium]
MIGCKVMRTLASVEIEIMLILRLPCCLSSSSVRCLESGSRVPVPLPEDPYEAIRQAYLAGMDTEPEPFEGKARTPESPHILAPPTCHVEDSVGSGTSGARSTSSDSIAPLLPDHPLNHTTPALVLILRRTTRIVVRVPPAMSPGLTAAWKRYRGTSEIILSTDSEEDEEVEESLDSNSEDAEDEGPTAKDEDPAARDDGLTTKVEGLGVDDESYGLDDESHSVDDEIRGLDDEGHSVESDGFILGEEEAIPEGQQRAISIVGIAVSEPLRLGYGALRHRELALEGDHVYSTFEVGHVFGYAPEPEKSERVPASRQPTLTTWTDPEDGMTSGSLPISPSPSVVPSPVSSPMIPLTVPSPIASPMTTSTTTIPVDEDQFIEVGAHLELYMSILQDHTQRLDAIPPTLFAEIDRDAGRVDTRMIDMSRTGYEDHRLVYDMLLQQTALQRELQEMGGRVTALEQERDRKER